jgi:hypothetical protein
MPKRIVRSGDRFTSDELNGGEIELEEVTPSDNPPPENEQSEPWLSDRPDLIERERLYREFLRERAERGEIA